MKRAKRVYISDIHMNAGMSLSPPQGRYSYEWLDHKMARRFAEFLRYLNRSADVREVVILGDLMDDWVYPVDVVPPNFQDIVDAPVNTEIVRELKNLSNNADISVVYLPGNHDMGISKKFLQRNFPGMVFGGSALKNSAYRTSRLRAEHGSAYSMFNAPDPMNNPSRRLPLGYFISRVTASKEYETGSDKRHYWSYADDLLEALGPQQLAASVFEAILEEAGLSAEAEIKMPLVRGKLITITAGEVKERYSGLYAQWKQQYGPGTAFKGVLAEIGYLGDIADTLCKSGDTNIVVFGHSHGWVLDKDSLFVENRIYANCGTWCDDKLPRTFVETEKDEKNKIHVVRVMDWNNGQVRALDEKEVSL